MPRKTLWTPAAIALLGTADDAEVAKLLGRPASSVRAKRRQLGILIYGRLKKTCNWGQCELNMLGRYPDEEIAGITGRSLSEIIAKRNELNL